MLNARLEAAGVQSKTDELYIGMTPKALLAAMRKALEDARRGKFQGGALSTVAGAGAPAGSEGYGVALPSQETSWRGVTLDRNGLKALNAKRS